MSQDDVKTVKFAITLLGSMDKVDFVDAADRLEKDMAHLDTGSRQWARRLAVEKSCGMKHTDEINDWLAKEKERESRK
jgi:hypothetical protein